MQDVAPRAKPQNLALVIPISVADFLVKIGIGKAKDPSKKDILCAV